MELGGTGDWFDGDGAASAAEYAPADWDPGAWDWLPPPPDESDLADRPPCEPDPIASDYLDIAELSSAGFERLDQAAQVDALVAIDGQLAWLAAQQQHLLALIAAGDSSSERWCVEEVGAALRLSGGLARSRLKTAEQLYRRLPGTFLALRGGKISLDQARVITEHSFELPDERLPGFEQRVLARAADQSLAQTRQSAKRAALAADPATAEVRHRRALADRHVRFAPADDGMAWLLALLPAAEAQAMHARLDTAARHLPPTDTRTMDQRRADALIAILLDDAGEIGSVGDGSVSDSSVSDSSAGNSSAGNSSVSDSSVGNSSAGDGTARDGTAGAARNTGSGSAAGRCLQPVVSVVVGLSTLVGADDEPGWLDGYGAIPASYARRLAHDPSGTWRRLVTDPVAGQPLDYGTTRYRPPKHLADHVIARDGTCTFPCCQHIASRADLDHITPFDRGPTSAQNLQPLHRRHHNAKTHGGWRSERDDATGWTTWTSPIGRTYRSRPAQRWKLPDDPPF